MGKGTIKNGGTNGLYQVEINYDRRAYNAKIEAYDIVIAAYDAKILAWSGNEIRLEFLKLQKTAVENAKKYLIEKMPEDETVQVWCADLIEDLSGQVGTIEIPGERQYFNIQPGYGDNSDYDLERDGQLVPTISQTPAQAFYNLALLPGWQKWKPLFRYAIINSINILNNTANITLEDIKSSQQDLDINQTETLSDVEIEYMECDNAAFEIGDEVLIKFEGQNWSNSKIIGFKENPKPCDACYLYVRLNDFVCFIWDLKTGTYAEGVVNNDGISVSGPILRSDISDWLGIKTLTSSSPTFTSETKLPVTYYELDEPIVDESTEDCNIFTVDAAENFNITGYDNEGNTGASGIVTANLVSKSSKEVTGQTTHIQTRTFSIPIRGYCTSFITPLSYVELTSTTNFGGIKSYTFGSTIEEYLEYEINGVDPCSSLEGLRVQNDFVDVIQSFKSPFIGTSRSTSYRSRENQWLATESSTSAAFSSKNQIGKIKVDGIKGNERVPFMVVFMADQFFFLKRESETCGMIDYLDLGESSSLLGSLTKPVVNSTVLTDSYLCNNELLASTTYESAFEYRVKAYVQEAISGDVDDLDPFSLSASIGLSTAMEALKDFYESIYGVPVLPATSENDFDLKFLI